MTGAPLPPRPRLRLVPRQPQPQCLEVRITAADNRGPIGRSRPLCLSDSDLERLIATAERLESLA